jgi:single-strand DNA-binding protein
MPNGNLVVNMSVATTRKWQNKKTGELQEEVTWHNVTAFDKIAEGCQTYLKKGNAVLVEGRISNRSWEDENGVKKYATEIIADSVDYLTPRSGTPGGAKPTPPVASRTARELADEIPF